MGKRYPANEFLRSSAIEVELISLEVLVLVLSSYKDKFKDSTLDISTAEIGFDRILMKQGMRSYPERAEWFDLTLTSMLEVASNSSLVRREGSKRLKMSYRTLTSNRIRSGYAENAKAT